MIDAALNPRNFLVPPPGVLRIERSGAVRQVWLDRPDFPVVEPAIEIVPGGDRVEVFRNIPMRDGSAARETVGTAPADRGDLLARCIEFALVGTSRLAIASVETPHPVYSLGMLAYLPPSADAARVLEAKLRAGVAIESPTGDLPAVLRTMFNRLALSPYTVLVDRLIALILRQDRAGAVDALGYMLRHLARHLNAFDLVRFHNRGANYPDALMLDAVLRAYVGLLDADDANPMHRRALRQGWLARKRCEGLLVPDRPTSPGENARLGALPPVPDSQLTDSAARRIRLFKGDPAEEILNEAGRALLTRSSADLSEPRELHELGAAVFLDRPLGAMGKRDRESDRTVLLSYEAVSPRLIKTRLAEAQQIARLFVISSDDISLSESSDLGVDGRPPPRSLTSSGVTESGSDSGANPTITGFAVAKMAGHARTGVVALEDAKKVALDFVFTRTTRSSLDDFLSQYDFAPLNDADPAAYQKLKTGRVLLIRTALAEMTAFDESMKAFLKLIVDDPEYVECGGVEYVSGLFAEIAGAGGGCRRVALLPRW